MKFSVQQKGNKVCISNCKGIVIDDNKSVVAIIFFIINNNIFHEQDLVYFLLQALQNTRKMLSP